MLVTLERSLLAHRHSIMAFTVIPLPVSCRSMLARGQKQCRPMQRGKFFVGVVRPPQAAPHLWSA